MEVTQPRPFAAVLRQYRTAAGITQEELAERAGLSSRGVSLLERSHRQPYRDTVRRFADASRRLPRDAPGMRAGGLGLWGLCPGRSGHADLLGYAVATRVDDHDLLPGTRNTCASRYIADELRVAELYGCRLYSIWIDGRRWMECVPLG